MTMDSTIPGFYRKSVFERLDTLVEKGVLTRAQADALAAGDALLPVDRADAMIENVIGVFGLPLAVAGNFIVDGVERVVPMVVEEPSIVAGLSGIAKLARRENGFKTEVRESLLAGQVQLVDFADGVALAAAIDSARAELLDSANAILPRLVERGGGARDLDCRLLTLPSGEPTAIVHVYVDTCDAMGANLVNTVCEHLATDLERLTSARAILRILSNLVDRSLVSARATIPLASLRGTDREPEALRDDIVVAAAAAAIDPYRAATHNKGVMNGVDAVAIATGNDWRAIEAGVHAYAARDGQYRSLTDWQVDENGNLSGSICLPLKVGVVGGSLRANPGVEMGLAILGVDTARELAGVMAAVGLAQNFAALRALAGRGIQHGHMRLHARSVAATAGVPAQHVDEVVAAMIDSGEIKVWKARELVESIQSQAAGSESNASVPIGQGVAAGKVILLGEHSAVYDKHVLALPLPAAVVARVAAAAGTTVLEVSENGRRSTVDFSTRTGAGVASMLKLIAERLGCRDSAHRIHVTTQIPAAMGLGSSAAFAVALIRGLADLHRIEMDDAAVNALAFDCEKLAHGTPSGIDNTLATYGRAVLYRRNAEPSTVALDLAAPTPLVVASSGQRGVTRDQVAGVRARMSQQPDRFNAIFDEMDRIALAGTDALKGGEFEDLGSLMNLCQGYLNAIGVSTVELERMISIARGAGAVGAKLTGGGGGGSIVALCPGRETAVADALHAAGYEIISARN